MINCINSCERRAHPFAACSLADTVQLVRRTSQPNPNIYRVEAYINSKYGTICRWAWRRLIY